MKQTSSSNSREKQVLLSGILLFCLLCSVIAQQSSVVFNGGFENGLSGWVHDANTYPIGTSSEPIGAHGASAANLGTFDQPGSRIYQDILLSPDSTNHLQFWIGANASHAIGREARCRVSLVGTNGFVLIANDVSVLSKGYPNRELSFVEHSFIFEVPTDLFQARLKFEDLSPGGGIAVDLLLDSVSVLPLALNPPVFNVQPDDRMLTEGQTLSLLSEASGARPIRYQWFRDQTAINGATNNSHVIPQTVYADSGEYRVKAENSYGATTSRVAKVTVEKAPNLIVNGSFESGLSSWERDASVWEISAGVNGRLAANLGTSDQPNSFIEQTIVAEGCTSYVLSFASAANTVLVAGKTSILEITITARPGVPLISLLVTNISVGLPSGSNGFTTRSFPFRSPNQNQPLTLRFRDVSAEEGRGVDAMIDNIQILESKDPDPGTLVVPAISLTDDDPASSGALTVPIRFQEVYSATLLPTQPITIKSLSFRPDSVYGFPFTGRLDRIQFTLSTTRKEPGSLDTVFDSNFGPDRQIVFDGPLVIKTDFVSAPGSPKNFEIPVQFTSPFDYNPSNGNLLVEIRNYSRLESGLNTDGSRSVAGVQRIFFDGDPDAHEASSGDSSADVLKIEYCPIARTPLGFLQHPVGGNFPDGSVVLLSVEPIGYPSPSIAWLHDGRPLPGETRNVLTIPAMASQNSGSYQAVASNVFETVTSQVARVHYVPPPTVVSILVGDTESGSEITLTVRMKATGFESGLGFSIAYDRALFQLNAVSPGSVLNQGTLVVNTNSVSEGRVGILIASPPGTSFPAGEQDLVRLQLKATPLQRTAATIFAFTDNPLPREVVDVRSGRLPAIFNNGASTMLFTELEGDVLDDGTTPGVTVGDWIRAGLIVAGLTNVVSGEQFRRADCAPRQTKGDGALTLADWVQTSRYVASLDPPTPVGGPSQAQQAQLADLSDSEPNNINHCSIRIGQGLQDFHDRLVVPIEMHTLGGESALSLTVKFDPAEFTSASFIASPGLGGVSVQNQTLLTRGLVGVIWALPAGISLPPGQHVPLVLVLTRRHLLSEDTHLALENWPIRRSVVSYTGTPVEARFNIVKEPSTEALTQLKATKRGSQIELRWPIDEKTRVQGNRSLQSESWVDLTEMPLIYEGAFQLQLPASAHERFFRLIW